MLPRQDHTCTVPVGCTSETHGPVLCMLVLSPPVSPSLGNRGLVISSCMRGKQSGPEAMEERRRAFDTKPSTTALDPEPQ